MKKDKIDRLLKPLVNIYDDIELDLIRNILNMLDNYSSVQGSLEWYIEKLNQNNILKEYNKESILKNKKEIKRILENIISNSIEEPKYIDSLEKAYKKGLIDNNPIDFFNNFTFNSVVNNALKDTENIIDLIDSKVLEKTNEIYKKIINTAYIETASGIYTYQESIRKALKSLAEEGIRVVHYANGRTLGIESVVRRDVLTRINKIAGDITLETCKEMNINLVYVDQHEGARIRTPYMKHDYEAHSDWQGKVYMLDGYNEKYDNFYEKTGYGEMLGLMGINCKHNFSPYFEGDKIPKRIDKDINKKEYELSQKQRAYERKIRQIKREREVYKHFDRDAYKKANIRLKNMNAKYDKFLKDNDLRRDYSREYVDNKNTIQYSKNEKEALNYYLSPGSISLNEKLRNNVKLTDYENKMVDNLDSALLKTSNYEGIIVRDLELINVQSFMENIKIGETYSTNQYLSFSTGKRFNKSANVRIFIEKSKNAKDLVKINTIGEKEVLYERNKKFKTLNVQEKDGIIYVLWEEIE